MPNKKYYIIAASHKTCGLFAIAKNTIAHVLYALDKGYIPVVDLQHYQNQYFKDNREFKDNTWEYFFEQPCRYGLDDIPRDANIIISDNVLVPEQKYALYPDHLPIEGNNLSQNMKKLFSEYKKYFKINSEVKKYLEDGYKKLIGEENEILGILCRGTDYLQLKPKFHPIQPEPEIVLQKARELQSRFHYKKIYLATEDKKIYEIFKEEFGDILIDNGQYRYENTNDKYIIDIPVKRENHNYTLAMEYFLSIYILSKCKYFIGGRTSGTLAAYIMNNVWEYNYIWELGHYGVEETAPHYQASASGTGTRPKHLRKIFSVTNEYSNNIKHKVLNLCGAKLKFRVK